MCEQLKETLNGVGAVVGFKALRQQITRLREECDDEAHHETRGRLEHGREPLGLIERLACLRVAAEVIEKLRARASGPIHVREDLLDGAADLFAHDLR